MKKRILAVLLTVATVTAALSGCMQEKMGVTVNSDGSATISAVVKIEKEYYNSQMSSDEVNMFDEVKKESPNAIVKEYEETIKGNTYKCFDISEQYSSIAQAKKDLFSSEQGLFNSGTLSKTKFTAKIGEQSNEFPNESLNISKSDMKAMNDLIKVTFSASFPNKIVYTNGKLSKDGKTATWNLLKVLDGETICAYTNKKEIKASPVTGLNAEKNGNKATVKWSKAYKVSGYQIKLGTNKKLTKNKKTVNIKKNTSKSKIKGLKSDKKYYVKIRSYVKVGSKKYYSKWSKVKTVK